MEELMMKLLELGGMTAGFFFLLRQNGEMRKEQSISLKEMAEANKEQVIIMERISSTLTHLENRIDKMEGDIKQLKGKGN